MNFKMSKARFLTVVLACCLLAIMNHVNCVPACYTPPPPETPQNLTAAFVDGSEPKCIALNWTDVADEEGYVIERSPDGVNSWLFVDWASADQTSFQDPYGIQTNTYYYYRVYAYNSGGNSGYSNVADAVAGYSWNDALNTSGINWSTGGSMLWTTEQWDTHDGVCAGGINFGWYETGDSYLQMQVTGPVTVSFWWKVFTESSDYDYLTVELDGNVQNSISGYYFDYEQQSVNVPAGQHTLAWVYHKGGEGSSYAFLDQVSFWAAGGPTNLAAATVSSAQINLTWTDNASNETAFKIERSPNGTSFTEIATVPANMTSFQDTTGLSGNTTYYYRVRALVGSSMFTGYSNTASATTMQGSGIIDCP